MSAAAVLLELAVLGWGVLCGAIVYEHLAIVPVWEKCPPESLTMWRGPHRVRAERLWVPLHPMVVSLLVASLVLNWYVEPVATRILITLVGYLVLLAATAAFFVPELKRLVLDEHVVIAPAVWRARSVRWERLSIARGGGVVVLGLVLFDALRLA